MFVFNPWLSVFLLENPILSIIYVKLIFVWNQKISAPQFLINGDSLFYRCTNKKNLSLPKISIDPSEFILDIEAYKKQSEIDERYTLNRFRERWNKINEDQASHKRKYFQRYHVAVKQRFIDDYFANQPTYDDAIFRRRFWMQKHVFLRIIEDLSSSDNYFTQWVDASNKEGISPLAKCTIVIQMLAYGIAPAAIWARISQSIEYIKIGGITALEGLRRFCKRIIQLYE